MDNDVYIPFKFRASQIVGLTKVAVKYIEANGIKLAEEKLAKEEKPPYKILNQVSWFNKALNRTTAYITGLLFEHKVLGETHLSHELELGVIGAWGNSLLNISSTDVEPEDPEVMPSIEVAVVDSITKLLNGRTVLDALKRSSFMQLRSPEKLTILWGIVSAAGAKVMGSTGWTVAKNAENLYTLTLTDSYPLGAATYGADSQGTQRTFTAAFQNPTHVSVAMTVGAGPKEAIQFSFLIIGTTA